MNVVVLLKDKKKGKKHLLKKERRWITCNEINAYGIGTDFKIMVIIFLIIKHSEYKSVNVPIQIQTNNSSFPYI